MSQALVEAFLRMDELMLEEAGRKELQALARGDEPVDDVGKKKLKEKKSESQLEAAPSASREGKDGTDDVKSDGEVGDSDSSNSISRSSETVLGDGVGALGVLDGDSKVESSEEQKDLGDKDDEAEAGAGLSSNDWDGAEEVLSNSKYRGPAAGCTAVVALIQGDTLLVANAGDSRCIVSRKGQAIEMSTDHKPDNPDERARIMNAGGFVTAGRVNASLNLSRALGDMEYKQNTNLPPREQIVTAYPEVRTLKLEPGDDFLVLACDGIWDVKTNQQVVDFVRERLSQSKPLSKIVEELFDTCIAPNTSGTGLGCDNMSAIVVTLPSNLGAIKSEPSEG